MCAQYEWRAVSAQTGLRPPLVACKVDAVEEPKRELKVHDARRMVLHAALLGILGGSTGALQHSVGAAQGA